MSLPIEVISAGAGSGKTYTLTERMVKWLREGVRPSGIIATTFTKKAAAELQERVRARLLKENMTEAAHELDEALIGTVHSIGTRLLQRFAFEVGVSPLVEIIAEGDEQRIFNESLSQVLSEARIERMIQLADRLGLTKKNNYHETYDWRREIRQLTNVARANNFDLKTLEISKQRSWESFARLLPPPQETDPSVWRNRLLAQLEQAATAIEANETDTTQATKNALINLRLWQNQLSSRGELYWHEWVKISKTEPGAKSRDLMAPLRDFALTHDAHPQFQEDIRNFIETVFDIAADALREYEYYKKKRGLIDYTDMETYVSQLVRIPSVRQTLQEELDLLLVDEFQDTSPIQLDIFLQISQLAKKSIWVGDPKQSIYGFRGAEPALMQAIIGATGGVRDENILKHSWRSRPDIVHATNAIFERAFHHMPKEQVALSVPPQSAHHIEPDGRGLALQHWHFRSELDERKVPGQPWLDNCIATQIRVFLERSLLVYDKSAKTLRPVRPGDITVLCRNNDHCRQVADALHRAGLKATIARNGLLETPEAKLTIACMRYLLMPSDALAAAEIALLTGHMSLEEIVEQRIQALTASPDSPAPSSIVEKLLPSGEWARLASRTADLSASEIVNLVLEELDLRRYAVALGNPEQRLDNLDRLRCYALDYESACQRLHSAATLGGFLLWLSQLAEEGQDTQGFGENEEAVKVLTYHRSKGLEYPVAVCHSLDQKLKENIWGLNLVSETEEPDLNNILGNRWLRFWVNPYSDQFQGTRLAETLAQTLEWAIARQQALDEEARLLYVGLTRARDYLVFPTTIKGTPWLNRVFNQGNGEIPTLDPDSDETPFYCEGKPLHIQTEIACMPKEFGEAIASAQAVPYHSLRFGKAPALRPNLYIDAWHESATATAPTWGTPMAWGHWMEFQGDYNPAVGMAAITFLIADNVGLAPEKRKETALKQLEIRKVAGILPAEALLKQGDALRGFLANQFKPTGTWAKYPLETMIEHHGRAKRLLRLEADLYLETAEGPVVFAFAPFAEGMKKWKQVAQPCANALSWWRQAKGASLRCWVLFPMEGQAVELI